MISIPVKNINTVLKERVSHIDSCLGVQDETCRDISSLGYPTISYIAYGCVANKYIFAFADVNTKKVYTVNANNISEPPVCIYTFENDDFVVKLKIFDNKLYGLTANGKLYLFTNKIAIVVSPNTVFDIDIVDGKFCVMEKEYMFIYTNAIRSATEEPWKKVFFASDLSKPRISVTPTGSTIIVYSQFSQSTIFMKYDIMSDDEPTPHITAKIISAVDILCKDGRIYAYANDGNVYVATITNNNPVFTFSTYPGHQWVGRCSYYDGYIYMSYLNLAKDEPGVILCRSIDGIYFDVLSEDLPYKNEMYGYYCQGNYTSIYSSSELFAFDIASVYNVDFSRYVKEYNIKVKSSDVDFDKTTYEASIAIDESVNDLDYSSMMAELEMNDKKYPITSIRLKVIDGKNYFVVKLMDDITKFTEDTYIIISVKRR